MSTKKRISQIIMVTISIIVGGALMLLCINIGIVQCHVSHNGLLSHEEFVKGLYRPSQVFDSISVFKSVFTSLADEVTVFPTENYYYFKIVIGNTIFKGNIGLFVDNRDEGAINFSCEEVNTIDEAIVGGLSCETELSSKDGIFIHKVNKFKYTISFEGKAVTFCLNDIGLAPPSIGVLMPDEKFIGPSFDESGLKFYLIYNSSCNNLFWILNDEKFVPEEFVRDNFPILIGKRTGFAFYEDTIYKRRILIAVKSVNVERNTWYDGPFDQLPDNYIKMNAVQLKPYLDTCYPHTKAKTDKYGIYLKDRDSRVAVISYSQYSFPMQLVRMVDSLRTASRSRKEFFCMLTHNR